MAQDDTCEQQGMDPETWMLDHQIQVRSQLLGVVLPSYWSCDQVPDQTTKPYVLGGVVGRFSSNVQHLGIKYPKNMGIPIRVCITTCFRWVHHDVAACSWINWVLIPPDVICSVVDTKHLGQVYPIIKNEDAPAISVRVFLFISIIIKFEQVTEQVIFQLLDKILCLLLVLVWSNTERTPTFVAGSSGNNLQKEKISWWCHLDFDIWWWSWGLVYGKGSDVTRGIWWGYMATCHAFLIWVSQCSCPVICLIALFLLVWEYSFFTHLCLSLP